MGLMEMLGNLVSMPNQAAMRPPMGADADKRELWWNADVKRRRPREQQWQLNMAMVMGNQWCGWTGTQIMALAAPSWRVQAVDNKLFVRVRSKMTRLLADMTPTAIPESDQHIDVRRARYKERLLHHIRREIGDQRLRFRAAQWVVTCGEVYTEAYWDESAGDTYADDGGAFSEGDVAVKIYDPFCVWPGAGSSAGNNGGRLWTVELVHVDLARMKYNDENIAPDATNSADFKLRASMDSFFTTGNGRQYTGEDHNILEEMVMVKTLREYRSAASPMGSKSVIIGKKVYDQQPLTWDGITHIVNYPSYNSYHGDAVELRNSIQRQKSYNRLLSNWEEYVRTMCKGKILAHKSCNIKSSQFDSEHMEIIKFEGSGPAPTPWMPPPLPSDTGNLLQLNLQAIDDAFADHPASQGKAPASSSGAAINYLQEEDQRQHTPARDEWLAGWGRTWEKCLDVVAGHSGVGGYTMDRSITILGEDRRADVERVDEQMLAGRNRVYIAMGGALPENKTLRAEVVRRWYTDGVLGDPTQKETRRKFMKLTAAGIVDDIYDDEALDEIRAEKENLAMSEGQVAAPRPEDDHVTHVSVHLRYMKSDDFLNSDPGVQEIFYQHLALTEELAAPPLPMMPGPGGPPAGPGTSPAIQGPGDMLKGAIQGAEPPPAPGAETEMA